jgi:hypothetical protein
MKQKYKLSKRAEAYLKAQSGLQVPYESPYQDDTTPFDLGQIDPSLQAAQQNQVVKPNFGSSPDLVSKPNPAAALSNLPQLKTATGLVSLFQSFGEKKKARRMKNNAEKDLQRRMKESRENDFYYTGHSSGMYSDFNKKGGTVYQDGGFMDYYNSMESQNKNTQNQWESYYQNYVDLQKQKANQLQQEGIGNIIGGVTDQIELATKVLTGGIGKKGGMIKQSGGLLNDSLVQRSTTQTALTDLTPAHLNLLRPDTVTNDSIDRERESFVWNYKQNNQPMFDLIVGRDPEKIRHKRYSAFDKSRRMKQEGGEINEADAVINEDLYSADFQSPIANQKQDAQSYFQETMNKYQALDPQGSLENKAMSWIFEEEQEPKRYDVQQVFQNQDKPILKVVEDFKMMGLNPSSIDSGKHNVGSRHYEGKAVDLGLNTTFGGDINKMKQFKQWFETEGKNKYPGLKLIDETTKPSGQKEWSGAHYHLEY